MSYQHFSGLDQLQGLVENDLAVLLSERFEMAGSGGGEAIGGRRAVEFALGQNYRPGANP